ncbi:META domain-containing protein [Victivallis vadensis]|uniref:META domain-containing protein n=1 Tax=Victivallis vadensis TaxID=172901 RepID=UPI00346554C4
MTRRSGPNQQYEQNFAAMLNLARHYSIRGDTLTLCGENKTPLATFRGTVPHNY